VRCLHSTSAPLPIGPATVRRSWWGAIDAAWEEDVWAVSTPVPLTVAEFRSSITTLQLYPWQFSWMAHQSRSGAHGSEPKEQS
jgi:hypothetical protein